MLATAARSESAKSPEPAASSPPIARWGSDTTPGWSMMTEQERVAHRDRMRSMSNVEECRNFHEKHHEQMMARAKERGAKPPAKPLRDPCLGLKPR